MSENYPPAATPSQFGESPPPASAEEQGRAEVVKNQASDLGHSSVQTGKHVADVAREQASEVAAEAVFLALAAGAGLAAGRLTRGLKDASSDDSAPTAAPARRATSGIRHRQPATP